MTWVCHWMPTTPYHISPPSVQSEHFAQPLHERGNEKLFIFRGNYGVAINRIGSPLDISFRIHHEFGEFYRVN